MKKSFLLVMAVAVFWVKLPAQDTNAGESLLWSISGKNLKKTSYLFGTFHLLTSAFIDTMPVVKKAYESCHIVAGELIMNTEAEQKMIAAARLTGSTLKEVLSETAYSKTAGWFKTEAGIELSRLNAINPMAVMSLAMAIAQQKYMPNPRGYLQLDTYFQEQGKKDNKKLVGLENIDVQINALYTSIPLKRQAELLNSFFDNDTALKEQMTLMYTHYTTQNLQGLRQLMYGNTFQPEEIKILLDNRNEAWMNQIPDLITEQPTFIAVGALHLTGSNGLIDQLRARGYTVTPIKIVK